jgi:hypothetical protein
MMRLLLLLCLLFLAPSSYAQETDDQRISYGEVVADRIVGSQPRNVYVFEALRCDFVSVRVTVTSGNLDPVLTILDDTGAPLIIQDDANGTQDPAYSPLLIPRTGDYRIVVGRFGYDLGTTTGTYELIVERIGNGSASNCAMRYGDTVFYTISSEETQAIYSFRATQGDIVNITMQQRSGDLDPYLKLVDLNGVILTSSDDIANSRDAAVQGFVIPTDGTYFIFATRYGQEAGSSTGNFSLTLQEAANSGLGNSPLAAQPIVLNTIIDAELTESRFARYYRFEARRNDIITVSMSRRTGNLDSYVILANASLQELAANDDISNETQNARINEYLIPANGTYYIIATRYQQEDGTTIGIYRLELSSEGNAFDGLADDVRRIRYGTSLTGTLDDETPAIRYAFWGQAGDEIRVTMDRSSGDLDTYLTILNADGVVIRSDDDSGINKNARIDRYRLPATGVYIIEAARFRSGEAAPTSGDFILILAQLFDGS